MRLAPEVADDILISARGSAEEWRIRQQTVRDEVAAGHLRLFLTLEAICFGLEQHGIWMLDRIDTVDEDSHTPVRSVLALIHSASTITIREIILLAEHGYWVGAAARWRGLHELAVTARLVADCGPVIAQRYLDHGLVVQTRRLKDYRQRHDVGPVPKEALDERDREARRLEQQHEVANSMARFRDAYGWAIPLVPKDRSGRHVRPTFERLEQLAQFHHRRLLVASAHGLVHNDAAGVRTAVLLDEGYSLGPVPQFTATVLRPTLESVIFLVAATHTCFEPELDSDFARLLSLQGAGLLALASDALDESDEGRPRGPKTER